jgi:carboxyl-terminal processing protease
VRKRFLFALSLMLVVAVVMPTSMVTAQRPDAQKLPSARNGAANGAPPRERTTTTDVEKDIAEAMSIIKENHIDGKNLDYDAVFKSSISSMLHTLDPHSSYFDPKQLEEFRNEQRSEYIGIGATLGDLSDGTSADTTILATFNGAPASRAGLRFGDRILAVDGESMRGKRYPETRKHLLGPRDTVVKVTVEHAATGRVETLEITRVAVPQPSIPEAYMLRPGIGYIALTGGFNLTTNNELTIALDSLHAQGMNMLVLDLRNNPGGLMIQAVRAADAFLRRGQLIVTQSGRMPDSSTTYIAENNQPDPTPLVIMVNRYTASAAEILAGALQDHDRAFIVGETSFGKGLVQLPFNLPHGSALMLTIAHYYTPSGRLIQRDYSNGGYYDYITNGGTYRTEKQNGQAKPAGPEKRTDTGRPVYGGGGITPDETVKPRLYTFSQRRLVDSVLAFAREVSLGHLEGFNAYKVDRPIEYGHVLKETDFPVSGLYQALRNFVTSKPAFKITGAQLDRERAFVERQLRYDLVSAAYGTMTALQVFNVDDPEIARSVELLPRARDLALAAQHTRIPG